MTTPVGIEREPPAAELTDVGLALRAAVQASDKFRASVAAHVRTDITAIMALGHIHAAGTLTMRELADRISHQPSSVTDLLNRLEGAGLAQRNLHPNDRRKTVVSLTDVGTATLEHIRSHIHDALSTFTGDELPALSAMLIRIAAALEEQTAKLSSERTAPYGSRAPGSVLGPASPVGSPLRPSLST